MATKARPILLYVRIGKGGSYNKIACRNVFYSDQIKILRSVKVVYDDATQEYQTWNSLSSEADPDDTELLTLIAYEGNTYYVKETIAEVQTLVNKCCVPIEVDGGGGGNGSYSVTVDTLTGVSCSFELYAIYFNVSISDTHLFTNATQISFDISIPPGLTPTITLDTPSSAYHITNNVLFIDDSGIVPSTIKILLSISAPGYACDEDVLYGSIGVDAITNLIGDYDIAFNVEQFSRIPG